MNNSRYKKWSGWLIRNGFENLPNRSIFEQNEKNILFSNTCSFSENFIKERYFMFFSDEEIVKISKKIKKDFFSKRSSMYDASAIAKKLGISINEAEIIVEERKSKTSGTIDNFIKRHGEKEGTKRFKDFCKKSSHTKDKYIKKHGKKEGIERWNHYIQTKGKSREDYLKEFGNIEGEKKWEEIQNKRKIGSSKNGIECKYGKEYYDNLIKQRTSKVSLEGYIKKYGLKIGSKKWSELKDSRDVKSFESILKKNNNNHKLAQEIYEKRNMQSSPIYAELKKIYGEELAIKKYKDRTKKNYCNLKLPIHKSKPHLKSKKGCISLESKLFFEKLENLIGRKLKFGNKKNELKIFNEKFMEIYYYDCFDEATKTIIEFNGVAFHPKENQQNFINVANNKKYKESFEKDQRKIDYAKSLGYTVHVIWSDEVRKKHERNNKLNFLKEEMKLK